MHTDVMVSMNGVSLNSLDERIILQRVNEGKPAQKYDTAQTGGRIGLLVTGYERTELQVDIEFSIADIRNYIDRARILQQVNAWAAQGGTLTVNYRPGMRLSVLCSDMAAVGYVREWDKSYTLTMKAWGVPYWEGEEASTVDISRSTTAVQLLNPGTAPAPLEMDFRGMQTFGGVSVTDMDGSVLAFNVPGGEQITSYDAGSRFTIGHNGPIMVGEYVRTVGGSPVTADPLRFRTTASADELWLQPGLNELQVAFSGATYGMESMGSYARLVCRGRWV